MAFIMKRPIPKSKDRLTQKPRRHIPKKIKDSVLNRYDGKCGYCGKKPLKLAVDHIWPVCLRGSDDPSNLMPACRECNNFKSSLPLEVFRVELQKQLERAFKYSVNFRMALRFNQLEETPHKIIFYFERHK